MCGGKGKGDKEEVLSTLKQQVDELEEDLQRQTRINGITLKSCIMQTLESSTSSCVQSVKKL